LPYILDAFPTLFPLSAEGMAVGVVLDVLTVGVTLVEINDVVCVSIMLDDTVGVD
jgi:hypothetical protein